MRVRQPARALVTECDEGQTREALSRGAHLSIWQVPHDHGIGLIPQFMMSNHYAHTFNDTTILHVTNPLNNFFLIHTYAFSDSGIRA